MHEEKIYKNFNYVVVIVEDRTMISLNHFKTHEEARQFANERLIEHIKKMVEPSELPEIWEALQSEGFMTYAGLVLPLGVNGWSNFGGIEYDVHVFHI